MKASIRLKLEKTCDRFEEVGRLLADPSLAGSSSEFRDLSMEYARGGGFDFLPHVYAGTGLTRNSISYRISDHYPLWVEFEV